MSVQSIRPSRLWYWVAGVLLAGAVLTGQVKDFQRVEVPGRAELTFAEPGGYVVYLEGAGLSDASDTGTVHVQVEPTNGNQSVSLSNYQGDLSYSLAGYEGRAVASVQIGGAGTYVFTAGDATRPGVTHRAVGRSIGRGIVVPVILLLVALLVGGITALRRRRARRRAQSSTSPAMAQPTPAPGLVPAGWQPDSTRRHEYRFWDGTRWTEQVSDHGTRGVDPLSEPLPPMAAGGPSPSEGGTQVVERPQRSEDERP